MDVEDLTIKEGPNGLVPLRILRPRNAPTTLPVIVYLHGVGWVLGNKHTHNRLIRELAFGAGAALGFPNYSLSPEVKYATAIEESYTVLKWVVRCGVGHGVDPERLAVAGDNVGGNMAALTLCPRSVEDRSSGSSCYSTR
jgi:acetyl esterase